jgi:hypothetical protein
MNLGKPGLHRGTPSQNNNNIKKGGLDQLGSDCRSWGALFLLTTSYCRSRFHALQHGLPPSPVPLPTYYFYQLVKCFPHQACFRRQFKI